MKLLYYINLMEDGSVVTKDGEHLGTWEFDENDHPSFTPNGAEEPLFFDPFIPMLCKEIEDWHRANNGETIVPEPFLGQEFFTDK